MPSPFQNAQAFVRGTEGDKASEGGAGIVGGRTEPLEPEAPATGHLSPSDRRGSARLASIALAAVLIILSSCALFGAIFSYRAGAAVKYATQVSGAFDEARYAVGAEESLERKYRLEPSAEVLARHREAGDALLASLGRAQALGADVALIDAIYAIHERYRSSITRMFTAIDARDTELANQIDAAEVDPTFDAIDERVSAAAERHRLDAVEHMKRFDSIQRMVLIATPMVFLPGLGLVLFFWRLLGRYRQQAADGMIRETNAIRRSEQRFRSLVQNASDVVLICSATGSITYQTPTAETAWGYVEDSLLDQTLRDLVHPDDQGAFLSLLLQLHSAPGTTKSTELQLRTSDGAWRYVELIMTNLLHEPSVAGLVVTAQDITERKAFERQLVQHAFYDSLTGLPNRALFRDRLDQAMARAERSQSLVGVLFLDLDNFKQVNDSLGHQVGDILLAEAAARLQQCVRGDSTVARLGGDEFVVLLEHLKGADDAVLVAERIAQQLSQPFCLQGRNFMITASIGIALGQAGQDAPDGMLRDADVAMYRAKCSGKGCHVIFDCTMQTDILARLELESDLRSAIARGEMRVYYQPIMLLGAGTVAGVEALVRWQHPTRGLVSPTEFIPISEETGIILPLGQWVLHEACRHVAALQAAHLMDPPLTVCVNLSPRQFQQPTLLEDVNTALLDTGLPATSLKLEITEGIVMRDVQATIDTLWQLKNLGVKLSVDDFGTGYSSLAYLKRLPLDVLKIDRSFVSGIADDLEDAAIVRAIISMAKSLNLSIVAEGIETAEQCALLQAWGCDGGQGYYFARPLEAGELTAFLLAERQDASKVA